MLFGRNSKNRSEQVSAPVAETLRQAEALRSQMHSNDLAHKRNQADLAERINQLERLAAASTGDLTPAQATAARELVVVKGNAAINEDNAISDAIKDIASGGALLGAASIIVVNGKYYYERECNVYDDEGPDRFHRIAWRSQVALFVTLSDKVKARGKQANGKWLTDDESRIAAAYVQGLRKRHQENAPVGKVLI